jgi:hypothetical protein
MSQTIDPKMTDRKWLGLFDRPHRDLREFLERAESVGEVMHVKGANWDLELGALAEIVNHKKSEAPALIFEDIAGYPKGFRVLSGSGNSSKRMALMLGFPMPRTAIDVVQAFRDRMKLHKPIPPVTVKQGPILENIDRDENVDLYKFPAPRVHERDGGRYIGTEDLVIMRDPEEGWVNAATYRVQVHSKNTTGLWMSPGKHGRQIRDKYFKQGKPCPVLVCCGHDPLLFLAAANEIKFGVSEFDYAGGHRGEPFEVIPSEIYGLPMPAHVQRAAGDSHSSRLSSQRSHPDNGHTHASAVGHVIRQVHRKVRHDLGCHRARGNFRRAGRVVPRSGSDAFVQRDFREASLCRAREAGRPCGCGLPGGRVSWPLRRRGR